MNRMSVSLQDIIPRQFVNLPGIVQVQHFGVKLLILGTLCSLCNELYRAATGRGYSLVQLVVRTAIAGVLLTNLQEIGLWFDDVSASLAQTIGADEATLDLLRSAWKSTIKATSGFDFFKELGLRSLLSGFSFLLYAAMLGAETWVLDFLYPIRFSLALFGGLFAVPLGVFPKMRTMGPWLRTLVQIALWPIIFHFVMSMALSAFKGVIEEMGRLDVASLLSLAKDPQAVPEGSFKILLMFFCISIGHIYVALKTPDLAAQIMASETAETLSGMVGAAVTVAAGVAGRALMKAPGASAAAGHYATFISALQTAAGHGSAGGGSSPGSGDGGLSGAGGGQGTARQEPASLNTRSFPVSSTSTAGG